MRLVQGSWRLIGLRRLTTVKGRQVCRGGLGCWADAALILEDAGQVFKGIREQGDGWGQAGAWPYFHAGL
jgi:hypothetical protein